MKKIQIDPTNIDYSLIKEVKDTILNGGVVAIPTETVYGLAVRVDNQAAVNRLFEIKRRPTDKPFSFAMYSINRATDEYFSVLSPFGFRLIEKFWPGPLTIVYYSKKDEKIGIRVPSHVITQAILKELDLAVFLPSANISGEKEATSASEVEAIFGKELDLIVDGGNSLYKKPSTVVDLTFYPFKILREGVISEKEIIDVFIKKRIVFVCTGNSCRSPLAEFIFKKYLTEKKPYLKDRYEVISRGISAFDGANISSSVVEILKSKEDLDARNFRAKRIDRETILSSDLIFTMEDAHNRYILNIEPTAEGRIFNLKKFLPYNLEKDIPDPIGKSYEVYEEVFSLIKTAILELIDWV